LSTEVQIAIGIVIGTVAGMAYLWKAGLIKRRDIRALRERNIHLHKRRRP